MRLSCVVLSICLALFYVGALAQRSDSVVVVTYSSKDKGVNNKMNRMKVEPQLTNKLFNTGRGHDAYKLEGGMICLSPDSAVLQPMVIVRPKD